VKKAKKEKKKLSTAVSGSIRSDGALGAYRRCLVIIAEKKA